jgi:hypothetical protein
MFSKIINKIGFINKINKIYDRIEGEVQVKKDANDSYEENIPLISDYPGIEKNLIDFLDLATNNYEYCDYTKFNLYLHKENIELSFSDKNEWHSLTISKKGMVVMNIDSSTRPCNIKLKSENDIYTKYYEPLYKLIEEKNQSNFKGFFSDFKTQMGLSRIEALNYLEDD